MNATVQNAIAANVALIERVVDPPTGDLGYGTDLSCDTDLSESMPDVSGTLVLAQAIVRRLDCPRGALPDDASYGKDLRGMCNRGTTTRELSRLAGEIRTEVQKDDRVSSVAVTVEPTTSTGAGLRIALVVTPVNPRVKRFALTLAVTTAAVLIEELRNA